MVKAGAAYKKIIPSDVTWINFERSDASPDRWPSNTTPNTDETGFMNYMKFLVIDDEKANNWRITIGNDVARLLEYSPGNYALQQWPPGYQLYDHLKGAPPNVRSDLYLMGSVNVGKFRSAAEFTPHAVWLISDPTMDRGNCKCKYCSKVPQRHVSDWLGLNKNVDARRSSGIPRSARPRATQSNQKVHATIRRAPKPVPISLLEAPKDFSVPERERDVRAAISSKGMKTKRWAREGELVWCSLDPPIVDNEYTPSNDGIILWPGVVKEIRLKPQITPATQEVSQYDVEMSDGPNTTGKDGCLDAGDGDHPYTITHSVVYKLKLLAVQAECLVPDDQLLPYQAYAPPTKLLTLCGTVSIDLNGFAFPYEDQKTNQEACMEHLSRGFSEFQPILDEQSKRMLFGQAIQARFRQAVGPFALAIQQAAHVAGFWTPTDLFAHKMLVSNAKTALGSRMPMASLDLQNTDGRALAASKDGDKYTWQSQTRFQGLWWGAERIWMEELVRLKVDRTHLAWEGQAMFRKPASPGPVREQYIAERGTALKHHTADMPGVDSRGIFMFIDGIFLAVVPQGSGVKRECRVSGRLYELADEDYIDQDEPLQSIVSPDAVDALNQGKGQTKDVVFSPPDPVPPVDPTLPALLTSLPETAAGSIAVSSSLSGPSPPQMPLLPNTDPFVPLSHSAEAVSVKSLASPSTSKPSQLQSSSQPAQAPLKDEQTSLPKSLSGPPDTQFPLPAAPAGYRFRPVLLPGYEAVLDVSCISGRYYPSILSNPLISKPIVRKLISAAEVDRYKLWGLEDMISIGRNARNTASTESDDMMTDDPTAEDVIVMPDGSTVLVRNIDEDALWALEGLCAGVKNAVDPSKWKPGRLGMVKEAEGIARTEMFEYWRDTEAFSLGPVMGIVGEYPQQKSPS